MATFPINIVEQFGKFGAYAIFLLIGFLFGDVAGARAEGAGAGRSRRGHCQAGTATARPSQ